MREFESFEHKYHWVRQYFAKKRKIRCRAPLKYQPDLLMQICKRHETEDIVEAIHITLSEHRENYFKFFVGVLGETTSNYDWSSYFPKEKE